MSSTTDFTNVDVLIIGAGPAGLMAAIALVRAGVRIRIVDQRYTLRLHCEDKKSHMLLEQRAFQLARRTE